MAITQQQYNVTNQTIRNLYVRVNLLNFSYQTIDSLEGNVIDGSVSINANSDIRRTCEIKLVINNSTFDIQAGGKIFLDRYIQIFIGIVDIHTNEIVWYNLGIYLINAPSYNYNASENTLSFEGLDLMSKMTGVRNGYLTGVTYKIPQGSNIRSAMIAILEEAGFKEYIVAEIEQKVPYDMEFDQGSTQYDILKALRDVLPQYQIYFDVDGIFHYDMIPSGQNENITIDDSTWVNNIISEQINVNFEDMKNSVEVYGRTHDIKHYPSSTSVSGGNITLTISSYPSSLTEFVLIGFTPTIDISTNVNLILNSFGTRKLVDSKGNQITSLKKDIYYVAYYQKDGTWLFLGRLQPTALAEDTNPDSPFYIGNPAGKVKIVLFGNEYENIQSDELALERANFEIYTRCRLNDNVTLSCVPIYYLDVHQLASYTTRNNKQTNQYMIQSISFGLKETDSQSITMSRYYPFYPIIQ